MSFIEMAIKSRESPQHKQVLGNWTVLGVIMTE